MRKNRHSIFGAGKISGVLLGALIYLLLFVICSSLAALLAIRADSPMDSSSLYSLLGTAISAALGGFILCKAKGDGGVKHSSLCALCAVLVLLVFGIIVGGGLPEMSAIINYLSFVGSAFVFAFIGRKKERRHKIRRVR